MPSRRDARTCWRRPTSCRLGGFDERLAQLADWDLWIRLASLRPAAATSDVLVGYVMHDESMLLTDERDVSDELEYFTAKLARHGHEAEVDPVCFSRWVAGGHLRAGRKRRAARELIGAGLAQRNLGNVVHGLLAPTGGRGMFAYWRLTNRRAPRPWWLELYSSSVGSAKESPDEKEDESDRRSQRHVRRPRRSGELEAVTGSAHP